MANRWQITCPLLRSAGKGTSVPLVTLVWRWLRAEHQRRGEERRLGEAETEREERLWIAVADEVHRLRRSAKDAGV